MGQRCCSNNPWHSSHRARWPHGTSAYVLPFDLHIAHTFGEFRYNIGNMAGTGANGKLLSCSILSCSIISLYSNSSGSLSSGITHICVWRVYYIIFVYVNYGQWGDEKIIIWLNIL